MQAGIKRQKNFTQRCKNKSVGTPPKYEEHKTNCVLSSFEAFGFSKQSTKLPLWRLFLILGYLPKTVASGFIKEKKGSNRITHGMYKYGRKKQISKLPLMILQHKIFMSKWKI